MNINENNITRKGKTVSKTHNKLKEEIKQYCIDESKKGYALFKNIILNRFGITTKKYSIASTIIKELSKEGYEIRY